MCVSKETCQQNLDLLFTMLDNEMVDSIIKCNFLIGIGDLQHRYPLVIEPYLSFIYKALRDKDKHVRKTCLMVITHLVLGELLRVKSEVSNIVMLIQDPDLAIRNQVKLFFHEVNKKDAKTIMNFLPDIVDKLSDPDVPDSVFTTFAEEVLHNILDKDKQVEMLTDKLLQKLAASKNQKAMKNISYVLSLFNYNERTLQVLLANFEGYRQQLEIQEIW